MARHHHYQRGLRVLRGYLVVTGSISTIWPLFGMCNQLLASSGLIIVTTMIIRMNKARYAWITAVPGSAMAFITMYAGYLLLVDTYIPQRMYLLATLAIVIMVLMVIVFVGAFRRWAELLHIKTTVWDEAGDQVLEVVPE